MKTMYTFYNGRIHNNENKRPAVGITCKRASIQKDNTVKLSAADYILENILVNGGKHDTYVLRNIKTGKQSAAGLIAAAETVSITEWSAAIAAAVSGDIAQLDFKALRADIEKLGTKKALNALALFDKAKTGDIAAARALFEYMFTSDFGGKMAGMVQIGTSVKLNPLCKLNQKITGSVCEHCYSNDFMPKSKAIKLAINTLVLCTYEFSMEQIPYLNCIQFRFESFGDLLNHIQAKNYMNMAVKNPHVFKAIFTKRPEILYNVLMNDFNGRKPEGLKVIYSSLFMNDQKDMRGRFILKDGSDMIDHVFTVFTADFAIKHNIEIHCLKSVCIECSKCYRGGHGYFINEIVKEEQTDYIAAMNARG